ncbi:MAG: EF-hand domain-containing protein [Rhodobacterales bacterium]|nr:EF-hand domain-containing protein [Rhodobacterales bacterium]
MDVTNSTAALSLVEMQKLHEQRFAAADTDGSGGLSLEEFEAVGKNMPNGGQKPPGGPAASELFDEIDADGDGVLTLEEMQAHFQQMAPPTQGALLQEQSSRFPGGTNEVTDLASLLARINESDEEGISLLLSGSGTSAGLSGDDTSSLTQRLAASLRETIAQLYENSLSTESSSTLDAQA